MGTQAELTTRQLEYLGLYPYVMPISTYLSNGFPNLYSALLASNTKCSALLDSLDKNGMITTNAITTSITNLTSFYNLCTERMDSMKRRELCSISSPFGQKNVSVEFYVFSTESTPKRTNKTLTNPLNVNFFQIELTKAKVFLETF